MSWFDWFFTRGSERNEGNAHLPVPPLDLLDRVYRLPDGSGIKIVGFQSGGKFLSVPFILRCRILDTGEVVLIDPMLIRRSSTDITPPDVKREASRSPHPRDKEEVLRIIGWSSRTDYVNGIPVRSHRFPIADQDEGEEGVR